MKSGKCPKCGCREILSIASKPVLYSHDPCIEMGFLTFFRVPVHRFVCSDCGYCESWIHPDEVARLRQKYPRWQPEAED